MVKYRIPRREDGRIDFRPRKHHGFSFFIMIMGFLLPPLAVAVRFGIGKDFFINCICTICGYIPGHGHNFFIQNIRNNEHRNRTPKWARRYGLVDDYEQKKLQKKRAWVGRYNDQNSSRQMYDENGNVYTYDRSHRFEDGDGPSRPRVPKGSNSQDGLDRYYENEADGRRTMGGSADNHSLRRSQSRSSIRSFGRRGAAEHDMLPGAAEAERRRGKSSRFMPRLGSGKGKADRHARSERVMHDSDYLQSNRPAYDQASQSDSLADGSSSLGGRRNSFEGPEDADATVGKRYAQNGGAERYDSKVLPPIQKEPRPVDIMNDNHQF